jgi:hypothetical protein
MKSAGVYNVGTIAGTVNGIRELCLLLYTMGEGRYIPNDQSSFGLVVHNELFPNIAEVFMNNGWACQCATMFEPCRSYLEPHLLESKLEIKDGYVYTASGKMMCLVHQYDRVQELKEAIEERYK